MPSASEVRRLFAELEQRYGRKVADTFLDIIADIQATVDLQRLIAAIQIGNLQQAIEALHLDAATYGRLQDAIQAAFTEAGTVTTSSLPSRTPDGFRFVVRFDARNPVAEGWLRQHSSELVTRIVDDQREAVRTVLTSGLVAGANPRTTALDIVGRVNRVTGKRTGGLLGLTAVQTTWAENYAKALAQTPPPADVLNRALRDRRFDRSVQKAIRGGAALPTEMQAKMVAAYRTKALKLRGDTIGKQETFTALAAARHEAYRQAVETGRVTATEVRKTWRHFASEHPRMQHIVMAGRSVGLDERFVMPDGTPMLYPHDPAAPAEHTLGCRCQADYKVNWIAGIR